MSIKFSREWAMPNADTFSIKPIGDFVKKYLLNSKLSVDPFARNSNLATYSNDINPKTSAKSHMDALDFLDFLYKSNIKADLIILDMPYTARQVSECYKEIGIKVTQKHTQIGSFYKQIKESVNKIITPNGIVLSFGYSTVGMGKNRGFQIEEIVLTCCGGAHFDIISMAERKL